MSEVCEKHHVLKRTCIICQLEEENKELRSLCLWSIRRLPTKSYKEFAYNDYDNITGEQAERV